MPNNDVYKFLKCKTYREEGTLVYPALEVVNFVERLEHIFVNSFDNIIHTYGVLETLCSRTVDICTSLLVFNDCFNNVLGMARLYMKLRIHYACKVFNSDGQNSDKRNRKY